MNNRCLEQIQKLVGNVTVENLKCVDCYVTEDFGMFIPSIGFCEYAITPQHSHPAYSFILSFSEEQSIKPVSVKVPRDNYLIMAMSPYIPHEEEKKESFTRYIAIFISKKFYKSCYNLYNNGMPEEYIWKQFAVNKDIMIYIKKFMSEFENKQLGYENILQSLSAIIAHQLIRGIIGINDSSHLYVKRFEIERVIEYMHQNFGNKLTVEGLAKLANMSESHFIRVFKKETKLTPINYLIKVRINKAKKMLRDKTKNITEIALKCGFDSTSHFSSCFANQFGSTPTEYRNLYSK